MVVPGILTFLYYGPLPLIWVGLTAIFVIASVAGAWAYEWRIARSPDAAVQSADRSLILSCCFGLLGLLIAFTFGLALDRHEHRRQLVVHEANAISSTNASVRLFAEPGRTQMIAILRQYAEIRLNCALEGDDFSTSCHKQAGLLRDRVELAAGAVIANAPTPNQASAFLEHVNEVSAIGVEQEAMARSRVPGSVVALLITASLISAYVLGNALGSSIKLFRVSQGLMMALLALSIVSILDLDRVRGGAIQISQEPLRQVVASIPILRPVASRGPDRTR